MSRPVPRPVHTPPRVTPGNRRDLGAVNWLITRVAGRVTGTPPYLFRTLGRHRRLFRSWLRFAGALMPGGLLSRRDTELVILRVAYLRGCSYEYRHHVRLGRRAGLTGVEIARIGDGPDAGWSPRDHALLTAVDQLHHARDLDDRSWAQLRTHFGENQAIELCLLVGHYEMLATTITALRINDDQPNAPDDPSALP